MFVNWFKKIENHLQGHALQLDPHQDKAYNPLSATAKKMSKDIGNVNRNAKSACCTGFKASSFALAISLERK